MTIFFYSIFLRYQVAIHYLFPLVAILQTLIIYLLSIIKKSFIKYSILFFIIILSIINFPKQFYLESSRSYQKIYNIAKIIVKKINLPSSNFNIVSIRETPLAILGYDYRFILRKLGYISDNEQEYKNSKYLLVISEIGELKLSDLKNWEIDQFGNKKLLKSYNYNGQIWYVFKKDF